MTPTPTSVMQITRQEITELLNFTPQDPDSDPCQSEEPELIFIKWSGTGTLNFSFCAVCQAQDPDPQGLGTFGRIMILAQEHRWAQSAMDRWTDTDSIDRYYRSILLVSFSSMLSIHRLKIFFFFDRQYRQSIIKDFSDRWLSIHRYTLNRQYRSIDQTV